MDIRGSRVLILGGSGLVGLAIARELLPLRPAHLVISGLTQAEAEGALRELRAEPAAAEVELVAEWGDVFLPHALKDRRRAELLTDPPARAALLDDLYGPVDEAAVERSAFGALLLRHRPQVLIDCINTATVFAYQNVFASATALRASARGGPVAGDQVERHLATLYLPQLIQHAQLALETMRRTGTEIYLKVGTSGTGGMGLNIPFTHSEEWPSKMLLAKSSLAGAQTLLLYLLARTPGAPAVKEIKPTAAISWKRIGSGEVWRGGKPIQRIDAVRELPVSEAFAATPAESDAWHATGEPLRGVYLDAGENGLFSPPEFEALTALGLMEFITPEEIAQDVVREIRGYPSGRDVVAALDAATSGPTYRAGVLRQYALDRMAALEAEQGVESVAYEMLGPPRLSKLLFEAALLGRLSGGSLRAAARLDAEATAAAAAERLRADADLRTRIVSIGLPILLPDGETLLRGPDVKAPPADPRAAEIDRAVERGWVDLRASNWRRWRERIAAIVAEQLGEVGPDGGSREALELYPHGDAVRPGALAAWVFRYEEQGERIKR